MELLNTPAIVNQEDAVFGVTPQFLHGPTLRPLTEELESTAGTDNWQTYLMKNRPDWADNSWTEYSLYWCYILKHHLRDKLYSNAKSTIYAKGESIWVKNHWERVHDGRLDRLFSPTSEHVFILVQSNIDIPLKDIIEVCAPRILEGQPPVLSRRRKLPFSPAAAWRWLFSNRKK
jgi:hypothetical protein